MAFEYLSKPVVIVPLVLVVLYVIYVQLTSEHLIPKHVPWVGRRSELFSKSRANLRSFNKSRELLDDVYYKVRTV